MKAAPAMPAQGADFTFERMRSATRLLAQAVFVLTSLWMCDALAQSALETIENGTAPTNSGPTGNGPTTASQVVTLRNNTNNPTGNTMAAITPAVTVTYSLQNQQYTGLTPAQGYPAATGGNAVLFGGSPVGTGSSVGPEVLYRPLSAVGAPTNAMFTSTPAPAGQGITTTVNAGIWLQLSVNGIGRLAPSTPSMARTRMADLVLTFNRPVTDPVIHVGGLGATAELPGPGFMGITTELDLISGGTLNRLSGASSFAVSGAQINNSSATINNSSTCTNNQFACGSVQVLGTGITELRFRVYMRADGTVGTWGEIDLSDMNGDGVVVGVSLPNPIVRLRKEWRSAIVGNAVTVAGTGLTSLNSTADTANETDTGIDQGVLPGSVITLTENFTTGAAANYASRLECTGNSTALSGNQLTVSNADRLIVCTFINERAGTITIIKDAQPNDAQDFAFTVAGTGLSGFSLDDDANAALSNTRTFAGLAAGSYSVTETALAGWSLTGLICTDPTSNSSGNTGTRIASINLAVGETVTCTFTNTHATDVSVAKTAAPDPVVAGQVVSYSIVVRNNGPQAVSNVLLTDTAGVGQNCSVPSTAASCTATAGATCPASVPVATLLASGVTVPTLAANSQVTVTVQCTVTASGTP